MLGALLGAALKEIFVELPLQIMGSLLVTVTLGVGFTTTFVLLLALPHELVAVTVTTAVPLYPAFQFTVPIPVVPLALFGEVTLHDHDVALAAVEVNV